MTAITDTPEWKALENLHRRPGNLDLRQAFADDPGRVERLTLTAGDLVIDLSKHLITEEVIEALTSLPHIQSVTKVKF